MTLRSLISKSDEVYQKQVEFIKNNNLHFGYPGYFGSLFPLDNYDLGIFVRCMDVFLDTGINHFSLYTEFLSLKIYCHKGFYGFVESYRNSYGHSITDDDEILAKYEEAISIVIKAMQFFEFEKFCSKTVQDFRDDLKRAETEWTQWRQENNRKRIYKKTSEEKAFHDEYFNFDDFNMDLLDQYFKSAVYEIEAKRLLEHDIGDIVNNKKDNETFIVVLFRGGVAERIKRTENVLAWIEAVKKNEEDAFGIYSVNKDYVEELLIKLMIHYPTLAGNATYVKKNNKAFTTISYSKRIYKLLYGWDKRNIDKVITANGIATYNIGNQVVLEKALIDTHIRRFLRQSRANKGTFD